MPLRYLAAVPTIGSIMKSASILLALTTTITVLATAPRDAAYAADVGCQSYFYTLGRPFPEEKARKLWPSGRRPTRLTCSVGLVKGPITAGDYDKIVAFYRQHHPFIDSFQLQSPGGSVIEATQIGRFFRRYLIEAEAPAYINGLSFLRNINGETCAGPDCICASACALVWFGASRRMGRVGMHRPRRTDLDFSALSVEAASAQYKEALRLVTNYLIEMGAPRTVVEKMVSTSSADVHWLDDGVLGDLPIERDAAFDEWLRASCSTLSLSEYKKMLALQLAENERGLRSIERNLYAQLNSRWFRAKACEHELISSNRDKLPAP